MQDGLQYGDREMVRQRCDAIRACLIEIRGVVGEKELAWLANMQPSHVSDALKGVKSVPEQLVQAAMQVAGEELRQKLASAQVGAYFAVERRYAMTPEERERELRRVLREKLGTVADDIEREAFGG